ncbi:PREDICTED: platelet factor 4-like [Propithecus coquereli]|uniref:platelet factor 4-like n=1 Tax=Propithecus coquereli TaxID=379532 RepID=UPI00063FB1D3|nr:PREDICTED: platelet factor 4-like [Propithecus coquereli]
MSFPEDSGISRARASPGLLLLGLLFLTAAVATTSASADPEDGAGDLQCLCVKTTSRVPPKQVTSLEVIKAGPHCPTAQLIATLKHGQKICLDQQASPYKKIIKKLLEI